MAASQRPPRSRPGYEFSELENQRFTRLAGAMQLVAIFEIGTGIAALWLAVPAVRMAAGGGSWRDALVAIAAAAVPMLVGFWTWRTGAHLRLIVHTQGDDIAHLMNAIGELTRLYFLQIWLFIGAMALLVGSLVLGRALDALR